MFSRRAVKCLVKPRRTSDTRSQQVRHLTLHEYQGRELLIHHNIPVPEGQLIEDPAQVRQFHEKLGGNILLKAQILKGGRSEGRISNGQSAGIRLASNADEGVSMAIVMLGKTLRTSQTGLNGLPVSKLLAVREAAYKEKWYLALTIDRENYCPVIIMAKRSNSSLESIRQTDPEKIMNFPLRLSEGLTSKTLKQIQERQNLSDTQTQSLGVILKGLWEIFIEKEATLLELDPIGLMPDDTFLPLDAKFTFDDAAGPRQPALFALRDPTNEVAEEVGAEEYGLVYVRMEGNIGNVVNGAGLAMATNDAIGLSGGASANFLDAGGQATRETMIQAFRIILADARVTAILVNIYGGITKCDMIARSIIGAASELGPLKVPVVVRLQGTNSAEGLKLLEEADLGLHVEAGFGEAARKAVELAGPWASS